MVNNKIVPTSPSLTNEKTLKTLVENRTIYGLEACELNLFETYKKSEVAKITLRLKRLTLNLKLINKKQKWVL